MSMVGMGMAGQGCGAVAFWGGSGSGAGQNFHGSGSYFSVWGPSDFAWYISCSAGRIFSCFKNSVVGPQHCFYDIICKKIYENPFFKNCTLHFALFSMVRSRYFATFGIFKVRSSLNRY